MVLRRDGETPDQLVARTPMSSLSRLAGPSERPGVICSPLGVEGAWGRAPSGGADRPRRCGRTRFSGPARRVLVRAGDGAAQRSAVGRRSPRAGPELVDQRADRADLVCRNRRAPASASRERTSVSSLAGAGERTLDAVSHGGDLAAAPPCGTSAPRRWRRSRAGRALRHLADRAGDDFISCEAHGRIARP